MTNQTFRDRLLSLIGELSGGNKKKFAEIIGTDPGQVDNWVNKEALPRVPHLINLREKLLVSVDWLLTGQGNKYLPEPGMVRESRPPYGAPRAVSSRRGDEGEILAIWQALPVARKQEVLNFARYQQAQEKAGASKKKA